MDKRGNVPFQGYGSSVDRTLIAQIVREGLEWFIVRASGAAVRLRRVVENLLQLTTSYARSKWEGDPQQGGGELGALWQPGSGHKEPGQASATAIGEGLNRTIERARTCRTRGLDPR